MNHELNKLIDSVDNSARKMIKKIAKIINRLSSGKITPNMITVSGVLLHLLVAWCIVANNLILAAILLIIFGLFDTLDGELARLQNTESISGGLLDATTDRFKEVILYTAIAIYFVNQHKLGYVGWAVMACGFSICVSYVKAKGEVAFLSLNKNVSNINQKFKDGLLRFEVRMLILVIGLLVNQLAIAVVLIAILALYTSLNRLINVSSALKNGQN